MATRLCTHQDDVALTNERRLQELPGEQEAGTGLDQLGGAFRQVWPPRQPGPLRSFSYLGPNLLCGPYICRYNYDFDRCDLEWVKITQPVNAGSET